MKAKLTKWDERIITVYELARQGLNNNGIAGALGICKQRLYQVFNKHPAILDAVRRGRRSRSRTGQDTFRDYVYRVLSPRARKTWNLINRLEDQEFRGAASREMRILRVLEDRGENLRKEMFLYALVHHHFSTSEALRSVRLPFKAYLKWLEDPRFSELMEEFHQHKKNFFEAALIKKVAEGDGPCTVFANKTLNRDRGYGDRLTVEHQGQVAHVRVDELDLPLEVRRKLLQALRDKNTPKLLGNSQDTVVEGDFKVKREVKSG